MAPRGLMFAKLMPSRSGGSRHNKKAANLAAFEI
jgi:hypothetical protein